MPLASRLQLKDRIQEQEVLGRDAGQHNATFAEVGRWNYWVVALLVLAESSRAVHCAPGCWLCWS